MAAEGQKIKLGYWRTRGLAQQIRLLLKYTNTPFEDIHYLQGPNNDRSSWFNVKYTFGFEFPNIPYLIDGDFKLTESIAIMRYIADQNNLLGATPQERAKAIMLDLKIYEYKMAFTMHAYDKEHEAMFKEFMKEEAHTHLKPFEELASKSPWIAGDNLTYSDFNLYEMLDVYFIRFPQLAEMYPALKKYHGKFEQLEGVKEYLVSDEFLKFPINSKNYGWGGIDTQPQQYQL